MSLRLAVCHSIYCLYQPCIFYFCYSIFSISVILSTVCICFASIFGLIFCFYFECALNDLKDTAIKQKSFLSHRPGQPNKEAPVAFVQLSVGCYKYKPLAVYTQCVTFCNCLSVHNTNTYTVIISAQLNFWNAKKLTPRVSSLYVIVLMSSTHFLCESLFLGVSLSSSIQLEKTIFRTKIR